MYKIEFTLKQHTPLIHFQHEQEGATLRATEVKPKLDRFIIQSLDSHGKQVPAQWMVGRKMRDDGIIALNYKLTIEPYGTRQDYAISSNPRSAIKDDQRMSDIRDSIDAEYINRTQYFADNQYIDDVNKHEAIRKGVLYDGVRITFFSFNQEVIELINSVFPSFIVSQNFGTRQTKGFGCFSIESRTDEQLLEDLRLAQGVTGIFHKKNTQPFQSKLQLVSEHYGVLKRGKTYRGYQKSKLWEHFCSTENIRWEKRKIKLHLKSNAPVLFNSLQYDTPVHRIDDCKNAEDGSNHMYIRALLGLAEQYEFVLQDHRRLKVTIKDALHFSNYSGEFAIDRFKSPVRYYITDQSIFLITEEINPLIHTYIDDHDKPADREFEFKIDGMTANKSFRLKVPKKFDLPGFIQKYGDFGQNLKR